MTPARGTALILTLLVLAGCGSDGTKARRNAVNAYFAAVGRAQVDLVGQQAQIDSALRNVSLTRSTPSEIAALRRARGDVDRTIRRMRELKPPADARRLHALVVQRFELQRSVLDELIATELYLPKLATTIAPLNDAAVALRRNLAASSGSGPAVSINGPLPASQAASRPSLDRYAAAFGGYGDALKPVSAKLETLTAPPIVRPAYEAERASLKRSIAYCDEIRAALLRRDIPAANAAIHSLFTVAAALNGDATRRRQAAAARAYDRRLHQIDALAVKANAERTRLVALIG